MANPEDSRGNDLADAAVNLATLKQSRPLNVASILLPEAIWDLKDNIMEEQH